MKKMGLYLLMHLIYLAISLHKYLYANANPVMNSDPTGYFTLGEVNTAMVIRGILGGMVSAGLNILRFLTRTDTSEPFNFGSLVSDMILGAIMGGFFGGSYAYASSIQSFAIFTTLGISGISFSGLSLYEAYEEWENGNEIMALVNLGLAGLSAFGSYKSFQGAARTPTGQKVMDWAKSVKEGRPRVPIGKPFDPKGRVVQKGVDPNTLKPVKRLETLDPIRQKNAVKYAGDKPIIVDREGKVLDGHHRLNDAIKKGRAVDVQIGY